MDVRSRENYLTQIMSSGFDKAAESFSKLTNRSVKVTNTKSTLVYNNKVSLPDEQGNLYVLMTRVIGDLSGKSFLIFSEAEYDEIINSLSQNNKDKALHEAFLMEIDNIISAPVVAGLSKALDLEVYGDVPQLAKVNASELNSFILGEIVKDDPASVIISTALQFEQKIIHPQFIWKLSAKILDMIPDHVVIR